MKQKLEIIKSVEVNDNIVIIIAKKIKEETKHCKGCEHFLNSNNSTFGYCIKHDGFVEPTDTCIEVGM